MSRQELADAVIAYLHVHAGRTFGMNAEHVAALERGKHRWPSAHYRAAFRAVLGRDTDAALGFYITRGHATDTAPAVPEPSGTAGGGDPVGPTLLRALLVERHWQVYRTFRAQFGRAARVLADREGDRSVGLLDVSERQFQRWTRGARPRPDACRVLESMFGHPIARLIGPAGHGTAGVDIAPSGASMAEAATGVAVPDTGAGAVRVSVIAEAGTAVTVMCDDGAAGRVAVVAGGVRVLIESSGPGPVVPVVADLPAVPGGARVYSLAERRAR